MLTFKLCLMFNRDEYELVLFISTRQAELGNSHSQTGVERDKASELRGVIMQKEYDLTKT